jgi:hypothetical protein
MEPKGITISYSAHGVTTSVTIDNEHADIEDVAHAFYTIMVGTGFSAKDLAEHVSQISNPLGYEDTY